MERGREGPSGSIDVYADLLSPPCRAVVLFLRVNDIPHSVQKPGTRMQNAAMVPEQSKINLVHLVPEIDDGGFVLTESDAILKYLSSRGHVPEYWYPPDLQQRARVDELSTWCNMNVHVSASYIYIYQILDPRIKNTPVDRERVRRHKSELDRALEKMEARLLAPPAGGAAEDDVRFVCGGDAITLADVIVACELMQPMAAGHDVMEGRPRVARWFERVKTALQPHFDEVHAALQHTRDLRLRMIYQCSSFDVDY